METTSRFIYETKDISKNVLRTRTLLRLFNNIRLSVRDIQEVLKQPTLGNVFWTIVQLFRTISTLRRLLRLLRTAVNEGSLLAGLGEIGEFAGGDEPTIPLPPMMGFAPMEMRVEAFRDNLPMGLENLDFSMIPEESQEAVQRVLEEDAPLTVEDAKRILASRVRNATGYLEGSIGWMPEAFGTRIYAGAPYAWWVEEGHMNRGGLSFFMGHHYLKDATDMARLRLPDKIRAELNKVINQEA